MVKILMFVVTLVLIGSCGLRLKIAVKQKNKKEIIKMGIFMAVLLYFVVTDISTMHI